MPSHKTSNLADTLKLLFIAFVIFYVVYIIKIPVLCAGCDPLVGVWYRCIAGTGVGTPTCDIEQQGNYVFSWAALSELNRILAESGLTTLPKQWLQSITNMWVTIKGLAQTVVEQTVSLYNVVKDEFNKIIKDYIIGYPVAGWEGFKSNVIIPIITGVTNYIVNPVKNLIQQVMDFKNTALDVLRSTVSTIKGVGQTIYEYTYGFLVDGFDQVPYGLVLFVQGIQNLLNMLKHGIISFANTGLNFGIDAVNFITQTGFDVAKLAVTGTQTAVDTITGGLNAATSAMIDYAVNPVIGGINAALNYDLMSPVRTGVNFIITGVNYAYNQVITPIINPIVDVMNVVSDGVVKTVNSISDTDVANWIPSFDIGPIHVGLPSFKPFSFIGHLSESHVSRLGSSFISPLNESDIPPVRITKNPNTISLIDSDSLGLHAGQFATSVNNTLTDWQATTKLANNVITEPDDLFWAGTKQVGAPTGDVCSNIANSYPYKSDSGATLTYATDPNASVYDQFNTATCLFSTMVKVTNNYIGQQSCSDVCLAYSPSTMDAADTSNPTCSNSYFIYGTPDQNAVPGMTTPNGLPIYLYKNQPCVYFAPNLYRLTIGVDMSSYTLANGKKVYTMNEGIGMITILDSQKSRFVRILNGGYRDTSTNKYYATAVDLATPGPVKAWEYLVNPQTDSSTTCNLEYLIPSTPEALGLQSTIMDSGIKVYMIDEKPYVFQNPKLLRLSTTMESVPLTDLNGSTAKYSFSVPYADGKGEQIATMYTQNGYQLNLSNTLDLPTQLVNNVRVSMTPQQAGFIFATSSTMQYYTNPKYSSKNFVYDKNNGQMIEVLLSNPVTITGTPQSNGYLAENYGFKSVSNGQTYVFSVTDQRQFYVVAQQLGYGLDTANKVNIKYTVAGGNITYNTPVQDGFVVQSADVNGLVYYTKNSVNYLYQSDLNTMVPLKSLTPSQTIYGQPDDALNGYSKVNNGYSKNSLTYYFLVKQRYLVEYHSKSLFNPTCSCTTTKIVSKTCKDFCGSKKDASDAQYGCDDSATSAKTGGYGCNDPRVTDFSQCVCTEQGPVNIVVKPMQQYNPFRLIQSGVSAAVDQLTSVIKYSIQTFLTPVWNTIKYIVQFMGALVWSAVQFVLTWLSTDSSGPVMTQIRNFLGIIKDGFNQYVVEDFVKTIVIGGIKSIIPTKDQIMSIIQPVINIFNTAFKAMVDAFKTAWDAILSAAKYLIKDLIPKILFYFLSTTMLVVDKATFFLPISKTTKLFILLVALLGTLLYYYTGFAWSFIVKGANMLIDGIFFVISTLYNLVTG